MGCCISKCRPQSQPLQLQLQLQHKLPISKQASSTPIPQYSISKQISASPLSPTSSASSLSSFTCTSSSSTLTSIASSSSLTSERTSFSNDFLWSCYQHHPHVLRINSLKQASLSSASPRAESVSDHSANIHINPSPVKPSLGVPHKRERSNSPANLTRQKSFRKDPQTPNSSALYNVPSRTVRSPSPSRRFVNGDARKCGSDLTATVADSGVSRRMIGPKAKAVSPLIRKQSVKGASSPDHVTSRGLHQNLRQRQSCSLRIGSKIDETVVKQTATSSNREMESTFMEDIDNPLISLDCFIFL